MRGAMVKKVILNLILVLFLSVGFISCKSDKATGLPMKVARYYWPGMYWVEIADKQGWFKEAGLNVELIDTNPDYFASLDATAGGQIDTNCFYLYDLMRFVAKGVNLVMVVNTDISFGAEGLAARYDIDAVRKLRGKKIGLTTGTALEYELSVVLSRNGLTPDDVTIVDMPGEKTAEALIKGNVDAIFTWEPFVTEAVEKGKAGRLFDTSEIPGISSLGFVFHRSFIEQRPEDVMAFLSVWNRATDFIKKTPDEAFRIIAEIYKKSPAEVKALARVDKILDLEDNRISFLPTYGFESLPGVSDRINSFMLKKGIIRKELDHDKFLDKGFVMALKKGGYRK
jgi:NitT/TauT family transport system substrate-binding protein